MVTEIEVDQLRAIGVHQPGRVEEEFPAHSPRPIMLVAIILAALGWAEGDGGDGVFEHHVTGGQIAAPAEPQHEIQIGGVAVLVQLGDLVQSHARRNHVGFVHEPVNDIEHAAGSELFEVIRHTLITDRRQLGLGCDDVQAVEAADERGNGAAAAGVEEDRRGEAGQGGLWRAMALQLGAQALADVLTSRQRGDIHRIDGRCDVLRGVMAEHGEPVRIALGRRLIAPLERLCFGIGGVEQQGGGKQRLVEGCRHRGRPAPNFAQMVEEASRAEIAQADHPVGHAGRAEGCDGICGEVRIAQHQQGTGHLFVGNLMRAGIQGGGAGGFVGGDGPAIDDAGAEALQRLIEGGGNGNVVGAVGQDDGDQLLADDVAHVIGQEAGFVGRVGGERL